jgi:hypothetical protein
MFIMSTSRLRSIKTEALELIILFILSTPPSRFMLSLVPPLLFLVPLKLLQLAISFCLPLFPVALTTFQLLLRLLHHSERIIAGQPTAFSFYSTRILVAPNILTWELSKHQLAWGFMIALTSGSVRCSIPGFVGPFAIPSGIAEAHALLLFFLVFLSFWCSFVLWSLTFAPRFGNELYVTLVILQRRIVAFLMLYLHISRTTSLDILTRVPHLCLRLVLTFQPPPLALSRRRSRPIVSPSRAMCMFVIVSFTFDCRQSGRLLASQQRDSPFGILLLH